MNLMISCIMATLIFIYFELSNIAHELKNITHELHEIAKHTSKEYKT